MDIAAFLFSQAPQFWGQALRNLYYSALTLARIKDVRAFAEPTNKFHTKVWALSPLPIRRYFSEKMRIVRARHDYEALDDLAEAARTDLCDFLRDGVQPFEQLIEQTRENIEKDYKCCSGESKNCSYCNEIKFKKCMRAMSLVELEYIQLKFHEMIIANEQRSTITLAVSKRTDEIA